MVRDRQPASKATTFADRQLDKAEKWRTVPKCDLRPRSWWLPVPSFFVVDARTQHTFLLGTPRHRKKAIPRASPYQVGLWKTQSCQARQPFRCRVEGAGGTAPVLGDEGKAVGVQSADGFAVCACHARPPLPAALVCRRTRRLLCRRIKWRAPYMIDEPIPTKDRGAMIAGHR